MLREEKALMKTMLLSIMVLLMFAAIAPADKPLPPMQKMQAVMYDLGGDSSLEQLRDLIEHGADVNAPIGFNRMLREGENPADLVGTTWPLDVALQRSRMDMVKLLLAHGAKLHGSEIAEAALRGNGGIALEMAEVLFKSGADPNARFNDCPAIQLAIAKRDHAFVQRLLSQPGIQLNGLDPDGNSALIIAAEHGSVEIMEMLLQAGANLHMKNESGETAITILQQTIEIQQKVLTRMQSAGK